MHFTTVDLIQRIRKLYLYVKIFLQSKLFDHDNMKYLKKLLDELESVMDQVETELQRRVEETPGNQDTLLLGNRCAINRQTIIDVSVLL